YKGLSDALRTLLVIKFDGAAAVHDIPEHLREAFAVRAERFSVGDLLRMLAQVAEMDTEGRLRKTGNSRILLEALLLRFAYLDRTIEIEELLKAAAGTVVSESSRSGSGSR